MQYRHTNDTTANNHILPTRNPQPNHVGRSGGVPMAGKVSPSIDARYTARVYQRSGGRWGVRASRISQSGHRPSIAPRPSHAASGCPAHPNETGETVFCMPCLSKAARIHAHTNTPRASRSPIYSFVPCHHSIIIITITNRISKQQS